ncbi:unnamed protein product, partial [Meganyctiphanes norvegica]
MSFSEFKDVIEEGDTVILYIGVTSIYAIEVKPTIVNKLGEEIDNVFQSRFGALKVGELIGKQYGSKVSLSRGWANVLYPTPELWTICLPHRTQILYSADISMVVTQLNIGPGSVVCEAGTGSGSLSHALLRAVGPSGHLHTRDFHKERAEAASKEFATHGLSSRVTVLHRDVCANGFGVENIADAVFLDLPGPWNTIHHAISSMKDVGGRLCSFSPCIEQLYRTAGNLKISTKIQIFEKCLSKYFKTCSVMLSVLVVTYADYNDEKSEYLGKKRKLEDNNEKCLDEGQFKKENFVDQEKKEKGTEEVQDENKIKNAPIEEEIKDRKENKEKNKESEGNGMIKFMSAHTPLKMAGHTGFLTFATLPPGIRSAAIIAAMKLVEQDENIRDC